MSAFVRATQRVPELTRQAIGLLGLLFFVVIAACATGNLIGKALAARTPAGMLATPFVLVVVAGIMAVGLLGRGPLRMHPLATGLAVLLVSRLVLVIAIPTPLISDFLRYHNLAIEVASRGPAWELVPIGWPVVLGAAYAVLGTNPMVGELLNVALAFVTGYLVYDIGLHAFGRRAGALGLWLFAVAPAQIIYVVVLGTEALYGALIVAAVWVVVRLGWGRVLTGVAAGALLGASQYVRATTPALIPAFALAAFLGPIRPRAAGLAAVALVMSFLLVLAPVILHNLETQGVPSVSTSSYGAWTLLVGMDPRGNGTYNAHLLVEVGGGKMGSPDFDRRALALAMARIGGNPVGVAALMVRKIPGMWADESYGVKWVFHPKNIRAFEMTSATTRRLLTLASQSAYACLTVMAAIAVFRRRPPNQTLLLITLVFLAVAAVHLVVEIQPRYHAYLVPLMCVVAGACFLPRLGLMPESSPHENAEQGRATDATA